MKFDVQVNNDQRSNNPQNGFIGRDEGDIEELLDNMVIVGEDRDEDIQWDRVVDAVEDINSSQEDNIRGVDQILRQDSRHGNHNQNPIRMWANPDANEIEAPVYRPGQDTILSDVDAVEAFNQIFNNQSAPTQTLQVAAEEHYLNQNSEALGGFEDIGNIKWAILEDESAHREEAPNNRGEHLTTNTNTQYDIHGFYIEEDGEPLEPEEVNSLMKKIVRRDQFNVPDSEPSEVPKIMLEYDSVEEAVSDREISREEFDSEYKRAQDIGLLNEEGNLTLKGWLSATEMQARDVRVFEDLGETDGFVSFPNLDSADLGGITGTEAVGKSGIIELEFNLPCSDVTIADSVYSGDILYNEDGYEVQGFGQLPEFLDEKGVDLIDRFYDVSVNDVYGISGAIEADISEIKGLDNNSIGEGSDSVQDILINQIDEEVTGEVNYISGNSDVTISSPSVDESAVDLLNSNAVEINDVNYEVNSEINFEWALSEKAPLDEIRETFDLGKVEKEIKDMMQSYEAKVLPEDFDHPNGRPGKAVEMTLNYDGFAAEYFNSSSGDPWPRRGSTRRDDIGNFYLTGRNVFEFDKPDMELYPFLIDQIKDDIESQDGSVEAINSEAVTVHNYEKLDENTQEKLDLIEESTLRTYTEDGDKTYIDGSKLIFERLPKVKADINTSNYLEVDTEADIESRTYQKTEEIQRIAEALDPMNMQKTPYEQITFETEFNY